MKMGGWRNMCSEFTHGSISKTGMREGQQVTTRPSQTKNKNIRVSGRNQFLLANYFFL
jgi:hypothetical protein